MSVAPPLIFQWSEADNTMRCLARRGGNYFTDGEKYILEARQERSSKSHRRFFAWVHECWKTLPEGIDKRFPNSDYLRKWCLVEAGFADEDISVWDSSGDARKAATLMRKLDAYAVITVKGNVVSRYTAKSQDTRSMDRKTFQASVEGVEREIAKLLGTSVGEMRGAESA